MLLVILILGISKRKVSEESGEKKAEDLGSTKYIYVDICARINDRYSERFF